LIRCKRISDHSSGLSFEKKVIKFFYISKHNTELSSLISAANQVNCKELFLQRFESEKKKEQLQKQLKDLSNSLIEKTKEMLRSSFPKKFSPTEKDSSYFILQNGKSIVFYNGNTWVESDISIEENDLKIWKFSKTISIQNQSIKEILDNSDWIEISKTGATF